MILGFYVDFGVWGNGLLLFFLFRFFLCAFLCFKFFALSFASAKERYQRKATFLYFPLLLQRKDTKGKQA